MSEQEKLLQLTQRLLDSISAGDWATYESLCDPTISAFEPEARGSLIEGMAFHRFYFDLQNTSPSAANVTMASPHVRMLGADAAVVSYVRLIQQLDQDGQPRTSAFEETRVWHRDAGSWRHVHFHRSSTD